MAKKNNDSNSQDSSEKKESAFGIFVELYQSLKKHGPQSAAKALTTVFDVEIPFLQPMYEKLATDYDRRTADLLMGLLEWLAISGSSTLIALNQKKGGNLQSTVEGVLEALVTIVKNHGNKFRKMSFDEQEEYIMQEIRKEGKLEDPKKSSDQAQSEKELKGVAFQAACFHAAAAIKDAAVGQRALVLINKALTLVDQKLVQNADPHGFFPPDVAGLVMHATTLRDGEEAQLKTSVETSLRSKRRPFSVGVMFDKMTDGVQDLNNPLAMSTQTQFAEDQQKKIEADQAIVRAARDARVLMDQNKPQSWLDRLFAWFAKIFGF